MKDRITTSFARLLRQLLTGEVNRGDFRGSRQMLDKFLKDGVLDFRVVGRQQQKIFCPDADNLRRYLHNKFEIPALDQYISLLESEDAQRSDAVKASSDSKIKNTRVFYGFFVSALNPVRTQLNGSSFDIIPRDGVYTFINAFEGFFIPESITVVIVENYENFREIERQRYLFEGINPLFVWRYQNTNTIVNWLLLHKSPYLHFGDFDLKGVHIYLSEFKSKLKDVRGRFFIPDDIERLIDTSGARFLYEDQKSVLPALLRYDPEEDIRRLISIITRYKKGLSQEILIR